MTKTLNAFNPNTELFCEFGNRGAYKQLNLTRSTSETNWVCKVNVVQTMKLSEHGERKFYVYIVDDVEKKNIGIAVRSRANPNIKLSCPLNDVFSYKEQSREIAIHKAKSHLKGTT